MSDTNNNNSNNTNNANNTNNKEINKINNNISNNDIKTNPNYYFDQIIGASIATHLSKFDAKNGFNVTNIFILIAMLSITEMQNIVKICSSELYGLIKSNYKPVFSGIYNCFNINNLMFYNIWKNRNNNNNNDNNINNYIFHNHEMVNYGNDVTIDINNVSLEFMEALYNVLHSNDDNIICNYSITNEKIFKYINMTTDMLTETYYNISLEYENINIKLENKLIYTAELCGNKNKIVLCNSIKNENKIKINNSEINYFHQLVNDAFIAGYLELIHEEMLTSYIGDENKNLYVDVIKDSKIIDDIEIPKCMKKNYNYIYSNTEIVYNNSVKDILKCFKYNYPNLILSVSYAQLHFVFNRIYDIINGKYFFSNNIVSNNKLYLLDMVINIPEKLKNINYSITHFMNFTYYNAYDEKLNYLTLLSQPLSNNFYNLLKCMYDNLGWKNTFKHLKVEKKTYTFRLATKYSKWKTIKYESEEIINTKQPETLNFECNGKDNISEITNKFYKLIKHIKTFSNILQTTNENIEIHTIKINKNITEEITDNPEYNEYLEKKELLKCNNDRKDDFLMNELMHQKIPDKKITNIKITKEIKTDLINTTFKTFDTLYLKENDEKKLKSVISKFHTKKEQLKSLGLSNKLCVLLNGKPGTGKSSIIATIATYLKKNIYYISFDNIETNDDLHNIVDHVIKNCNGGIIVCEDIDAIGNFLHKRVNDDFIEITTAETNNIKNNSLTMAYFLNLLQGTITPDGLIFIATTNHLEKLDEAFYRDGRFDVKLTLTYADKYQMNKIYNKFIGRNIPEKLLIKLPVNKITPATFIFTIKDYISEDHTDEVILSTLLEN